MRSKKKERERKKKEEKAQRSPIYRIRSIALTTVLIRNAIKRVIQVVIVTARIHFSPSGVRANPEDAEGSFPGSLACSYAVERRSGAALSLAGERRWKRKRGDRIEVGV